MKDKKWLQEKLETERRSLCFPLTATIGDAYQAGIDHALELARQLEEQKVVKFRVEDVGSDVESAWMGIVDEPKHLYFDLTIGARDTKQEVVEEIKLACEELGLRAEIEEG